MDGARLRRKAWTHGLRCLPVARSSLPIAAAAVGSATLCALITSVGFNAEAAWVRAIGWAIVNGIIAASAWFFWIYRLGPGEWQALKRVAVAGCACTAVLRAVASLLGPDRTEDVFDDASDASTPAYKAVYVLFLTFLYLFMYVAPWFALQRWGPGRHTGLLVAEDGTVAPAASSTAGAATDKGAGADTSLAPAAPGAGATSAASGAQLKTQSMSGSMVAAVVLCTYGWTARGLTILGSPFLVAISPLTIVVWVLGTAWDARAGHTPRPFNYGAMAALLFYFVAMPTGMSALTLGITSQQRDNTLGLLLGLWGAQIFLGLMFMQWRRASAIAMGSYRASVHVNLAFVWAVKLFLDLCFLQLQPFTASFFGLLLLDFTRTIFTGGFLQWDLLRMFKQRSLVWPPDRPLASVRAALHRSEQSLLASFLAPVVAVVTVLVEFVCFQFGGRRVFATHIAPKDLGLLLAGYAVVILTQLPATWLVRRIHQRKVYKARAAAGVGGIGGVGVGVGVGALERALAPDGLASAAAAGRGAGHEDEALGLADPEMPAGPVAFRNPMHHAAQARARSGDSAPAAEPGTPPAAGAAAAPATEAAGGAPAAMLADGADRAGAGGGVARRARASSRRGSISNAVLHLNDVAMGFWEEGGVVVLFVVAAGTWVTLDQLAFFNVVGVG